MDRLASELRLPPPVAVELERDDMLSYWRKRAGQHTEDVYAGVTLQKLPEDLRTYEHLLWDSRADTVIELGTCWGGSALWFRDRMRTLHAYGRIDRPGRVISVDVDQSNARPSLEAADPGYEDEIELVEADVTDPELPGRIAALLRPDARCLVVEDSAHVAATTEAALRGFTRFVPEGGYLVIEDGLVDVESMRTADDLPRGVLSALRDWLATPEAHDFEVRRDLELYGLSSNPFGFLRRRATDDPPAPATEIGAAAARDTPAALDESDAADDRHAALRAEIESKSAVTRLRETSAALLRANQSLARIPQLEHTIAALGEENARLVAERDVGWAERDGLQAEADELRETAQLVRRRLNVLEASKSWRLMAPLRHVRHALRRG